MNHDGSIVEIGLVNKHFIELNPISFGWQDCVPGHAFGPAVRRYTLLHYIIGGSGRFFARGEEFAIREGDAFLIRPDEVTVYRADRAKPWEYFWIGFSGRLASQFGSLPAVLRPDRSLMMSMMAVKDRSGMREEFLAGKLFLLLSSLLEEERPADRAQEAKNYLDHNYMHPVRLEALAASLGLDRRYLARLFKQSQGCSMQEYLKDKRMDEAARLLRQEYPVAAVGRMVSYDDPFAFSKAFRGHFGVSPRAWRERNGAHRSQIESYNIYGKKHFDP